MSQSEQLQFRILAPKLEPTQKTKLKATVDHKTHAKLLFNLQVLRGNALREYYPLAEGLEADGRHHQASDAESWHVLLEDEGGRVRGCARYRPVNGGFSQLGARDSALAKSMRFGSTLRRAVENHIRRAHAANMQYGEAGGWVLCPEVRCSTAAINIALMTFALAAHLGGGMGITTATTRHHSASMLRRLGGHRLAGLPAYYDPKYGCIIEILGFDMKSLATQFMRKLEALRACLESIQVICRSSGEDEAKATRAPHFASYAQRGMPASFVPSYN